MMKIKVGPSLLSCDFARLGDELKRAQAAGADYFHVDVMDGHFVPNITVGPGVVSSARAVTRLPLHAHLMIAHPENFLEAFAKSGADIITVHMEALGSSRNTRLKRAGKIIGTIKKLGKRPGVAINPPTPLSEIVPLLEKLDFVVVMSVHPGFGGQKFMPAVLPKFFELRNLFGGDIEVDGGINGATAKEAIRKGANMLAAGTFLFKAPDMRQAIEELKNDE